jgi:hypothetical protein
MALPASLKEFMATKRPLRMLLYFSIAGLAWLSLELKKANKKQVEAATSQNKECIEKMKAFEIKSDYMMERVRRSDSAMAAAIATAQAMEKYMNRQ